MKIYTKTGDKGQSSLADGTRVSKSDLRLEAYGTADELNAYVGWLRTKVENTDDQQCLDWIQNKLFNLGAGLAEAPGEWIVEADVTQLEQWIDVMQADLEPMRGFILPGGNEATALCHVCRTITRRLERCIVRLTETDNSNNLNVEKYAVFVHFVNRMSDFWFQFARKLAKNAHISLFLWKK